VAGVVLGRLMYTLAKVTCTLARVLTRSIDVS